MARAGRAWRRRSTSSRRARAVEQTRAQLPALQTSAAQTMNALARADRPARRRRCDAAGCRRRPPRAARRPTLPRWRSRPTLLRQRPDVLAAEARDRVARWRAWRSADADALPSLQLCGSLGAAGALTLVGAGQRRRRWPSLLPPASAGRCFDGGAAQAAGAPRSRRRWTRRSSAYRAAVLARAAATSRTRWSRSTAAREQRRRAAARRRRRRAARRSWREQRYAGGADRLPGTCSTDPAQPAVGTQDSLATAPRRRWRWPHVRLYKAPRRRLDAR
ncbi:MAG: hypothetical protein MZW92_47160 [Comamonadaceae bacterium]|nr:hypothetical protein [Comamonadaceae bacterium]